MAGGKHPELTVRRILDASLQLFLEHGYEKTSILDITNSLGDLTKGAIYHHFKSKEDILISITDRMFGEQDKQWERIARDPSLTGAEKLSAVFLSSVSMPEQLQFFKTAPNMLDNPRLLSLLMKGSMTEVAPRFVEPIVRQGVADGSIRTKHPKQLSEVILLLTNLWVTPLVFYADWEEMWERLQCLDELLVPCGISLCNDVMKPHFQAMFRIYEERK